MSQLYPPYLEGIIPAFYGNTIKIPFEMNPAVSWSEIAGFVLKIKNIYTNDELGILDIVINDENRANIQLNKILEFNNFDSISNKEKEIKLLDEQFKLEKISEKQYNEYKKEIEEKYKDKILLLEGMNYKCQLAYYNNITQLDGKIQKNIGYYSTVATVKYTYKPTVLISGLDENYDNNQVVLNLNKQQFIGEYINIDITEKVYSYCFNIYDQKNNLILTTGYQLHNNEEGTVLLNDNSILCRDSFLFQKSLKYGEIYTVQYCIKTINGLEYNSYKYSIISAPTVNPEITTEIIGELNRENGYIQLRLNARLQSVINGKFLLLRASNKDNYNNWETMASYHFNMQLTQDWNWKDFTIEHGVIYKYAFCQYNIKNNEVDSNIINIVSNRLESNEILAEFDDIFLYDGKRQLKIQFDPKISSFKTNQLESKIDTIGSRFPYFFKNGNVNYKEFPIAGLISYWTDNEELFVLKNFISLDEEDNNKNYDTYGNKRLPTTNLVSYNFDAEREFKMQVLKFLTDGNPKLFRSSAEGNFIVRLLNVSLTPNDTVGRMLHSFTSTAYEVDELNYDNLLKYNIYNIDIQTNQEMYGWKTIDLSTVKFTNNLSENLLPTTANSIMVEDVPEGTILKINGQDFKIGRTWQYKPDSNHMSINSLQIDVSQIKRNSNNNKKYAPQGLITYSYKIIKQNKFDYYKELRRADIILEFSAENENHSYNDSQDKNIIKQLEHRQKIDNQWIEYSVQGFNFIRFEKQEIPESFVNKVDDYKIGDYEIKMSNGKSIGKYDITNLDNITSDISLEQSGQLFANNLDKISYLELGPGVKAIASVRRTKIIYEEGYNPNEESST